MDATDSCPRQVASDRLGSRLPTRRRRRSVPIVVGIILAALGLQWAAPTPGAAAPSPGGAEHEFLGQLNTERNAHGLPLLVRDPAMDGVARSWSSQMAASQNLSHRPDLVAAIDHNVTTAWTRIGENVGVGDSVSSLHQAFMNSPSHRANVLGSYNRLGVGVVLDASNTIWVTFNFMQGPPICGPTGFESGPSGDYWLAGQDGGVFSFGDARFHGSTGGIPLNRPIVAIASTATGRGYWLVADDGGVFSFGDARFFGSTGGMRLNQPIVALVPTPTGRGYWLVARDGGIFSFGDADFLGSTGGIPLNRPIVGGAASPNGEGYWLVADDGGVFSFGDSRFHGSTGNIRLNRPIVALAPTVDGWGYWMVADDGGVFSFGTARYEGSTGGLPLAAPIIDVGTRSDGRGYWLVGRDGKVFSFSSSRADSTAPLCAASPTVGMTPVDNHGGRRGRQRST